MTSSGRQLGDLLAGVIAKWSTYTAGASFLVYVIGYLALRFRLTALGVGTDLNLLDERYLFEGAKFLVFLTSTAPIAVLFALPLAGVFWLVLRFFPGVRTKSSVWLSYPAGVIIVGIIVSVMMIQFVMRQCFLFDNLLLRGTMAGPAWFARILTDQSGLYVPVFFVLLLVSIAIPTGLLAATGSSQASPSNQRRLALLLLFLLGIQALLLPVNYGVLMGGRPMPRMAMMPKEVPIERGATAWLIWEGGSGVTYLVHGPSGVRKLLTVPRDKVTRVEIVGYDPLPVLRNPRSSGFLDPRLAQVGRAVENAVDTTPARREDEVKNADRSRKSDWVNRIMLMAGIGASPVAQRTVFAPVEGDIMLIPSGGGEAQEVTQTGGYRSPIFLPGDDYLLALHGDRLVEISIAGGPPTEIATIAGMSSPASKLVGIDPNDSNQAFLLVEAEEDSRVMLFDRSSGRTWAVTDRPTSEQEESMFSYLRGERREYGDIRLFVEPQSDPMKRWTDVFIQRGGERAVNLTNGSGVSNRQPALATGGRHVAYVRVRNR